MSKIDKCECKWWKQLQQLQAENEFKESQINDWIKQYKLAHQKYMKLQTENEKLKSDLQEETKLGHKAMCTEADIAWEVTKLLKALDEIEELCKVHTDFCKDNKKNCELCPHEPCEDILILEKIKEVKGNE